MILTPGELDRRSNLYRELGQMTESGLTLPRALETISRHANRPHVRTAVTQILRALNEGNSLSTALLAAGNWLPMFDIALLGAGEQSGRLPACFLKLSSFYEERARLLRKLLTSLAYPAFLIHMAVLVFPVTSLQALVTDGSIFQFLLSKILMLLPLYALAGLVMFLAQGSRGEPIRQILDRLLNAIPVVGPARESAALARLCLALEALINAGANTIHAWELSGQASGSPRLRRVIRGFRPQLESGFTPAEAVGMSRAFPEEFVAQVHSAELSGKMDETLVRMHGFYEEKAARGFSVAVVLFTGLVFALVAAVIAWQIIKFYMSYLGQVNEVLR
ncbi:MAG: hypothetical protein FJ405_17420 [Verrucomicrobia bacterium]|nr:hypothetical protein [Verrucomicrobiota bacterium]